MGTITKALSLVLLTAASHAQAQITMNVDAALRGPLTSPYQYGLFFEEINHAGEGGLYAELVKNRSFEDGTEGWQTINGATMSVTDTGLLNEVQGHALTVAVKGASASAPKGIVNNGYWGMALRNDSAYTLSLWLKGSKALNNHLVARLVNEAGTTIGEATLAGDVNLYSWTKLTTTITAHADVAKGSLQLLATADGSMTVDVVSLFPATWKGRANGLRPDLAQLLVDTHPTFLRFPGGCYVEGQGGYDNAFQWKKTIGPIEQRPGHWNRNWGYWSSDGLGFDEYLQLCEDLGAAPLFVVNVGLGHGFTLSLDDTKALVQDCLDAIEYANGDASTTWGAKRVANGHAAPYHLKFIEIGNENYQADANAQSNEYAERYKMFYNAIKAKYPDIVCIGNVEAWGTDSPSWRNANPVELVDEHYYRSADWMIANYNKYDNVSRSIGIYNGEYAANGGSYGKYGNLSSALGEAVYMLGMERNSGVCRMASFAPIFTHESNERSVYQSVQLDTLSNQLIVKLVNPYASARSVTVNLKNMEATAGTVQRLQSSLGTDENTMDEPNKVVPAKEQTVSGSRDGVLSLDAPAYSLSIYRYDVKDVAPESVVSYPVYEAEDKDKAGYLFVHMSSKGEFTSYSLSRTGKYWTDLLNGAEAFSTKDNTVTGGMRDAYVTRLEDGGFMLVGTDMTSRLGWTSNHIMDLMLSPDLVHWTKNVKIDLESSDNLKALGGITADQMTAAWAPQVIYDPVTRHYVVYYSVGFPDRHRIYYQLVDKDLSILTEPRLYFDPGYDIIDADIVYNAVDNDYQMVYKCESANGLNRATAPHLVPADDDATTGTTVWTITDGFHVSDNNQSIEAPTQWREIGQTKWKLSFINYSGGGYGYKTLGLDEHGLQPSAPVRIAGSNNAQHGCILKLTQPEYDYLLSWDSVKTLLPTVEAIYKSTANTAVKVVIDRANEALTLSTTFEENAARMTAAAKALSKVAGEVANFLRDEANQGHATDLTPLIANADFSKGSAAWEVNTLFTQANGQVAEFYNKNFDFHQTITNLPAGDYEIGVQSFFRNGNKEVAYAAHADGSESLDAVFYANDVEEPVMSLYNDSSSRYTFSPYTYPDNVSQANEAFNTYGLYNNTIKLTLAKTGDITLGIRKESWTASDWCCFDNFTLRYLGQATGIRNVRDIRSIDSRAYTLTGRPVDLKTGGHGVYIQDGKKIVR